MGLTRTYGERLRTDAAFRMFGKQSVLGADELDGDLDVGSGYDASVIHSRVAAGDNLT